MFRGSVIEINLNGGGCNLPSFFLQKVAGAGSVVIKFNKTRGSLVIFLFDLEILEYSSLLLGTLIFLGKGYFGVLVLGLVLAIAYKRVFMYSI